MRVSVVLSEPGLSDLLSINDYYWLNIGDKVAAELIDNRLCCTNKS